MKLGKELYNIDLEAGLKNGSLSIGLYHTAGKGTRLAPLPGAENNNKPGVKLAATVTIGGEATPMTILEGVIKQTDVMQAAGRAACLYFGGIRSSSLPLTCHTPQSTMQISCVPLVP